MISRRHFLGSGVAAAAALQASCQAGGGGAVARPGKTPHTKFAVNVEMWWNDLPFLDRIQRVSDLGFPAIEFWDYVPKDLLAIKQKCADLGVDIAQFTAWGFKPGMNNPENHDEVVRKISEACQVANDLGVRKMCVVGGDDQPGMTQEEMHRNIITALRKVAPIAEQHQVMLILEPMNLRVDHAGHCLYGSKPAVDICRAVDFPMVKINWDLYHMHITEGDLCGHMREGFDQVGYFQLADHPGRNEPGSGEIHYNRVLREAYELGYREHVGLECRPLRTAEEAAQAVWAADQW